MNLEAILEQRAKVEAFQRKHRIGLLTLLFTDLVGSTKLKQELGDQPAVVLIQRHHALVREILSRFNEGEEISTAGDSFFLVFSKPSDAVQFSLRLQNRLRGLVRETARSLLDRVGIHIGEVVVEERLDSPKPKDLYGLQVDICARVMSLAEGDQILLTRSAFDNARQVLKGQDLEGLNELNGLNRLNGLHGLQWLNHGPYLLKGVEEPLEICEVGETGQAVLKPPLDSEKVHRYVSPDSEPVLGWRPALSQTVPGTSWVLEEKLGEGGFGEVWLGRHTTTKEQRVFKFCFRADRVRSLKREVTLFRLLKERVGEHPNIVKVHDVYLDEPPFYLVIDYVEGRDLRTWCEAQGGIDKVPFATRLEIVAQVADALQAAHDAGVIHRDVKPSNILIRRSSRGDEALASNLKSKIQNPKSNEPPHVGCYDVEVKLTDFGIGQVVSEEALAGLTRLGFTQTMMSPGSSALTGTQMYMAPELVAGKPASMQSDIYSLGVVLFQLAVGDLSRPLTMDWPREIDEPRLVNELANCFAGNPEERFASAGQLAANLRSLKRQEPFLIRWRRISTSLGTVCYRALFAVGVLMVLGGLSGLCWLLGMVALSWWGFQPPLPGHDSSSVLGRLVPPSWSVTIATWLGVFFIYAARTRYQGGWETAAGVLSCVLGWYLFSLRISMIEFPLSPALILFALGFGLLRSGHKQHLRLSKLRKTISHPQVASRFHRVWTLASLIGSMAAFVFLLTYGVMQDRSRPRMRIGGEFVHGAEVTSAQFSPGGQRVLTASADRTARIWDSKTREILTKLKHNSVVNSGQFSPDGQRVVTASHDGTARIWDAKTGRALTKPFKHEATISSACFSSDGQRVLTASHDKTARIWDAKTGQQLLALKDEAEVNSAEFSADGERVVTASAYNARIWDAKTGQLLTSLLKDRDWCNSVHFSPDGQQVATTHDVSSFKIGFLGSPDGQQGATTHDGQHVVKTHPHWTARIWDTKTGQLLTELKHNREVYFAEFSPDGERVVTAFGFSARVWDAKTGQPLLELTGHKARVNTARFSPDGTRIVTASDDGKARIWNALKEMPIATRDPKMLPLIMNPDGDMPIPARDPKATSNLIDISPYYNAALTESWHAGTGTSDLALLPQGIQTLAEVQFDMRGLIQVRSESRSGARYPWEVRNIPVEQKCRRLHFLHSAIDASAVRDGTQIGKYVVHYANGHDREIPIVVGQDVGDWFSQSNEGKKPFVIAWTGTNEASRAQGRSIRLFKSTWENPLPDVEVKSIDFDYIYTRTQAAPFLIAITAE